METEREEHWEEEEEEVLEERATCSSSKFMKFPPNSLTLSLRPRATALPRTSFSRSGHRGKKKCNE